MTNREVGMPKNPIEPAATAHWSKQPGTVVSAAAHLLLAMLLLGSFHWGPKIAPYRFPGTRQGIRTLTYFSPGRVAPSTATAPAAPTPPVRQPAPKAVAKAAPEAPPAAAPQADPGTGASAKSGAGEGNINIAQPRVFPYPNADLSSIARGQGGDVILNAVIDETGKIAELTLVQGLSTQINETVIATVQGWSYAPATRDGVAVRSEQELRFHYERRG